MLRRRGSIEMVFGPVRQISPHIVLLSALMGWTASASHAESITDILARALSPRAPVSDRVIEEKRTRFRIGLEKHVKFQVFSLAGPNRVVVELPNIKLKLPAPIAGAPVGLVKTFRSGKSAPGQSRIVIEVTEPVVVDKASIERSADGQEHELALEIIPVSAPQKSAAKRNIPRPTYGLGASGLQPPLPAPAQRPSVMAAKSYKPVIVIDPGHGGQDSGAKKNGVVEKDVVLAFGKALRDKLEATGRYKVLMTRDRDVFIELSERVNYAERNKASLFMAIHADYARSKASGATVYSLRDSLANGLKRRTKRKVSSNVLTKSELATVKKA
ncbi:MAG: N-acetylmuramoyl-L-alanine amidase, partial [Alphaproteobacteria bacterium]|nr:N-acetylmuramoyl-L-alanine amidase [Alphaproteobacteria bacterium]